MNRVVLGTAPLGSAVDRTASMRILRAAIGLGIRRFDTAPLYGAGFATQMLADLAAHKDCSLLVSTKFGSPQENRARFLLKRALRAGSPLQFVKNLPSRYNNATRSRDAWWRIDAQGPRVNATLGQLSEARVEYLFMHSPPLRLDPSELHVLSDWARRLGVELGLCGPRHADVEYYLDQANHFGCVQLHLDEVLRVSDASLKRLLSGSLWIHGIYSPGTDAPLQALAAREAACVKLAAQSERVKLVVSCKSVSGLSRLEELNRILSHTDATEPGVAVRHVG